MKYDPFYKFKSIKSTLVMWFFLLSFIPIQVLLLVWYDGTKKNIFESIKNDIQHTIPTNVNFLDNWFHYRVSDIKSWSQSKNTIEFSQLLIKGLKASKRSAEKYINSVEYTSLVNGYDSEYYKLLDAYDYIHDILIIDLSGNILYTLKKESDLGNNLNADPYSSTLFTKTYHNTLQDRKIHFSDLERYSPSNNDIFAFFTAPIIDDKGNIIGAFATQIKSTLIINNFKEKNSNRIGVSNYLVGLDGVLRSSIDKDTNISEILVREINTKQVEHYKKYYEDNDGNIEEYIGPNGNEVFGTHMDIDILGVRWTMIFEIQKDVYLKSTEKVFYNMVLIMILSTIFIIVVAMLIARHITQPIEKLSKASILIAKDNKKEPVDIKVNNEIGQLASCFNNMLEKLNENEIKLMIKARQAQMGELLSMIAHQWRQPIGAISSTSMDLRVKLELKELDDKQEREEFKKYINTSLLKIEQFSQSLSTTIDDFRNFYKPNKSKVSVEITKPINTALEIVRAGFKDKNIEIIELFETQNLVNIFETELMQVILNILKNAQDNFQERKTVNPQIYVYTRKTDNGTIIEICDNGGGIPENIINDIFKPYFSTKDEINGTGLGLYMSKTIVENHHKGKLYVQNKGNNTCFFIELIDDIKKDKV